MKGNFDYFVVLAGMRTGSNLLEEQLAAMPGVFSHGELFNPHFFGKPDVQSRFGLSMEERDRKPASVIKEMRRSQKGLHGFRLFHDHADNAIAEVLQDPRAAKVLLSRRPIDSYVSLKIARKTGQWWLGDMTSARAAKVPFEASEYAEFLAELQGFHQRIRNTLQTTGQTAFEIGYEDLSNADVLAGLGTFLGAGGPPDARKIRAKVQNPTPVRARLKNPDAAEEALRTLATPDLGRSQIYEPSRGPGIRFFRACENAPLLYMPIRGAGYDPLPLWLERVDPKGNIEIAMTQKDLRRWRRQQGRHRAFTVLRHPLPRVHDAFCRFVLPDDEDNYTDLRALLVNRYDLPLPPRWEPETWGLDQHREAFLGFLKFLEGNLGGQTSIRVDNTWASQSVLLHAIGEFALPDRILREATLSEELDQLCQDLGLTSPEIPGHFDVTTPFALADVITSEIQEAASKAYRRDYVAFGFEDWTAA